MTAGPTSPPDPRTRTARTRPRLTRVWRQSLLLRVTVTTLVLSLIVVGLLGLLLL